MAEENKKGRPYRSIVADILNRVTDFRVTLNEISTTSNQAEVSDNLTLLNEVENEARNAEQFGKDFFSSPKTNSEIAEGSKIFNRHIRRAEELLDQISSSTQDLETSLASKVDTASKKSGGLLKKAEAIKNQISQEDKLEESNGHEDNNSKNLSQEEIDKLVDENAKAAQVNETAATNNNNNNPTNGTSNNANSIVDNTKKPLIAKFLSKYFNDDFANTLRSIDFGKYIFRSLNPEADMPTDPAELKNETIKLFKKNDFNDEKLVSLIIDKTKNDPGSVTFDMVADMVDSDAYKKFGQNNTNDRNDKKKFEKWIYKKSVLSKLDDEVLVTLHEESLKKVIDAIVPEKKKEDSLEKIDKQVESFKEFSDEVSARREGDVNFQKKLAEITAGAGYGYVMSPKKQLNELYGLIYNDKDAVAKQEILYKAWSSAKNREAKDVVLRSKTANANLTLQALTKTGAIPENAEKKPFQINEFPVKSKEFNPVTDVIRTFGMSVIGAGVFSALRAMPGIGGIISPVIAVANVFRAAGSTYKKEKAKASKNFDLKSSDVKKIAGKVAGAMLIKSLPYLATSLIYGKLGPYARAVSAVWVFVRTWYDDVNRSAAEQLRKENEPAPKKKGFFKDLKNNHRSISKKDQTTALAHAAAKAAVTFLGSQIGAKYGDKIGAWGGAKIGEMFGDDSTIDVGDKLRNFGDKFKGIFNRQSESPVVSSDEQVLSDSKDLMDTYENNRSYEAVQKTYHQRYEDLLEKDLMDTYENNRSYEDVQKIYNQRYQDDMIKNLSAESLAELDTMDEVELTDAARRTADVNNHRQYVDGSKQDWYTHAEQAKAVDLLERAGVDDPMGVLRKLGSAARFEAAGECENAGYQDALKNLGNGTLTNENVDAIQDALRNIDETGDLIRVETLTEPSNATSETSNNYSNEGATNSQGEVVPPKMKDVTVGDATIPEKNEGLKALPNMKGLTIGDGKGYTAKANVEPGNTIASNTTVGDTTIPEKNEDLKALPNMKGWTIGDGKDYTAKASVEPGNTVASNTTVGDTSTKEGSIDADFLRGMGL